MAELDLAAEQARVAELHGQADAVMTGLRAKLTAVQEAQRTALTTTGEATSRDGSVRAVVDATGVVTSLVFAPSAFDHSTPDRLAQAAVATIQAAAAKARAAVSATLAPVRDQGANVLAAASAGMPELNTASLTVPSVPRTATDPTNQGDPWHRPEPDSPSPGRGRSEPDDDESPVVLDREGW